MADGGLTAEEKAIVDLIAEVWNGFIKLKQSHPDDIIDFHQGVHALLKTLGIRVLRRDYPDYWIDKSE